MKPAKIFITAVALLLLSFVGLGLVLSGTWEARRETLIDAPIDSVFAYLDSVEGWSAWAPLGVVEGERSGPARGTGATLTWDDPEWGQGEWVLTASDAPHRVTYEVRVEEGSLVTQGEFSLSETPSGTLVEWRESGDFGWNPLLAFMALGMDRLQGLEMEKGLAVLRARVKGEAPPES
jgi:hypothetical protein